MKIVDKPLLDEMRRSPICQYCGRPTPSGCDPAHVLSRGAGGSDIRSNVLALCRGFDAGEWISCHHSHHTGRITSDDLWRAIARRDNRTFEEVKAEVLYVRNLPKGSAWPTPSIEGK